MATTSQPTETSERTDLPILERPVPHIIAHAARRLSLIHI